jgi:hypothetical protein
MDISAQEKQIRAIMTKASARLSQLVESGLPVNLAIEKVWVEFSIPNQLYEGAKLQSMQETASRLGLSLRNDPVVVEKAWKSTVDTGKTRLYVRNASARLRVNLEKTISDSIKAGDSIRQASQRIANNAKGDIQPNLVRQEINELARNPITAKEAKRLRDLIDKGVTGPELRASYRRVIDVAEKNGPQAAQKQIDFAIKDKIMSEAERVARTESERAYYAAETEKIAKDPDAKYVKIRLSPKHVTKCICDKVTKTDIGFGPGIYPKEKAPVLPLHPNCGCFITPVYVVKGPGIQKRTPEEALNGRGANQDVIFQNIQPKT